MKFLVCILLVIGMFTVTIKNEKTISFSLALITNTILLIIFLCKS